MAALGLYSGQAEADVPACSAGLKYIAMDLFVYRKAKGRMKVPYQLISVSRPTQTERNNYFFCFR